MTQPAPFDAVVQDDLLLDRVAARQEGEHDDQLAIMLLTAARQCDAPLRPRQPSRRRYPRRRRTLAALAALGLAASGVGVAAAGEKAAPASAGRTVHSRVVADPLGDPGPRVVLPRPTMPGTAPVAVLPGGAAVVGLTEVSVAPGLTPHGTAAGLEGDAPAVAPAASALPVAPPPAPVFQPDVVQLPARQARAAKPGAGTRSAVAPDADVAKAGARNAVAPDADVAKAGVPNAGAPGGSAPNAGAPSGSAPNADPAKPARSATAHRSAAHRRLAEGTPEGGTGAQRRGSSPSHSSGAGCSRGWRLRAASHSRWRWATAASRSRWRRATAASRSRSRSMRPWRQRGRASVLPTSARRASARAGARPPSPCTGRPSRPGGRRLRHPKPPPMSLLGARSRSRGPLLSSEPVEARRRKPAPSSPPGRAVHRAGTWMCGGSPVNPGVRTTGVRSSRIW